MLKWISTIFLFFTSFSVWANLPYFLIQFPRDEAAHFKNVPYPVKELTEWWCYNGKLTTKDGHKFGYYISYFYMQAQAHGKIESVPQFVMQLVDLDHQKTYAYGIYSPPKKSHFSTEKLDISLDKNLTLKKVGDAYVLKGDVQSRQGQKVQFALQLTPTRDVLLAQEKGLIDMWKNKNSYFYSYTHLNTAGSIQIGNEKFTLDPANSLSWMDHQWGDFMVMPGETQWMYANVQLENGIELTLGIPVDPKTGQPMSKKMSIVMPDGKKIYTTNFKYTPHTMAGHLYPLSYDLSIPEINLQLKLNALSPKQAANTVWEGVNVAQGNYNGAIVQGQAFTENTLM